MSRQYIGTHDFTGATVDLAAKTVSVADLADGTDGELITWDAAGVTATVATGSSGQVLTSNGAGAAPTFQAAGGGGGASRFDATVGSGGDFADIQAAITGVGGTNIKLVLISDVTEPADVTVPASASLLIHLSSFTVTMADFAFTYAGAANVYIEGNGPGSGAEIDYTFTSSKNLFQGAVTDLLSLQNCTIDNNSTVASTEISIAIDSFTNVRIECANVAGCAINADGENSQYLNLTLVGGGISCEDAILTAANQSAMFSNIHFEGTFIPSAVTDVIADFQNATVVRNLTFNLSTNDSMIRLRTSSASGIRQSGTNNIDIQFDSLQGASLSDVNIAGDIDLQDRQNIQLTNVITTGLIDLSDAGSANNLLENCRATIDLSVGGDRNKFNNCDFIGGAKVISTGFNNIFMGCQFGVDGGGGALTLTFEASSTGNNALGCISDEIMVDNGTGNSQTFTVY